MSGDGEAFEIVACERIFSGEKRVGIAPRLVGERCARILHRCRHTSHFAHARPTVAIAANRDPPATQHGRECQRAGKSGDNARLALVVEASNGLEAVEKAIRFRPTVVLMDIRMLELDGLEATRRILAALTRHES